MSMIWLWYNYVMSMLWLLYYMIMTLVCYDFDMIMTLVCYDFDMIMIWLVYEYDMINIRYDYDMGMIWLWYNMIIIWLWYDSDMINIVRATHERRSLKFSNMYSYHFLLLLYFLFESSIRYIGIIEFYMYLIQLFIQVPFVFINRHQVALHITQFLFRFIQRHITLLKYSLT